MKVKCAAILVLVALACGGQARKPASPAANGPALANAAEALQREGRLKDANELFRAALAAAPDSVDIRVRWGRLFLQTYNEDEAAKLFEEALKIDANNAAALSAMAEVLSDHWDGGADRLAAKALEANPRYVPALVMQAKHALEDEKVPEAEKLLANALEIDPDSLESLAMDAAAAYQRYDAVETQRRVDAVLKKNPKYGGVYMLLAHFAEMHRQFGESRDLYRQAIAIEPALWKARASLGIADMRLGREDEARTELEAAYKGDPFNPWTVNTLRLLDSYKRFTQFDTPHFHVKLQQKEIDVMRPYVEELLERAYSTFEKEYGFQPPEKTSFQMFPDEGDFAVWTVGVTGLGALGASFGKVVAMDSPAARPSSDFHWGSTLWHETAHVFTLQATGNRIPRWLTEGLSVYEEWRAGWGDRMELDAIKGLQKDLLIPIADLNRGYVRPSYPGEVQFAYYEGGMFVRFIVEKYGWPKIPALLTAYKNREENEIALERVLDRATPEIDKEFRAWMHQQTDQMVKAVDLQWRALRAPAIVATEVEKHPGNFFAQLQLAHLLEKDEPEEALKHAGAASELFPDFTGSGNGYELSAKIHAERGEKEVAVRELQHWVAAGGMDPAGAKTLAGLLVELHRQPEAIKALEGFLYIAPYDAAIHNQLGELYLDLPAESSRPELAVREYRVALALKPVDPATAHYNLARALAAAKHPADAKMELLAALEIAPSFRPAQKLLLELTDSK